MSGLVNSKELAIFFATCSLVMFVLIVYALLTLDLSNSINLFMLALGVVFAVIFGRQAVVGKIGGESSNG